MKGLKDIPDIRADHNWRAATRVLQFLPLCKGTLSTYLYDLERELGQGFRAPFRPVRRELRHNHSHSIVPGGLLVTSYTTRLTPLTSLMMRVATVPRKFMSKA